MYMPRVLHIYYRPSYLYSRPESSCSYPYTYHGRSTLESADPSADSSVSSLKPVAHWTLKGLTIFDKN